MRSTMMDVPLTSPRSCGTGLGYSATREVVTCTGDGTRRRTYAEAGRRAARLANALRGAGRGRDQRVGTFMWNNAEHLEAYLAIPSMGAVLHTLNLRLDAGRASATSPPTPTTTSSSWTPRWSRCSPRCCRSAPTVQHVIVTGGPLDETPRNRPAHRRRRAPLRGPARRRRRTRSTGRDLDEQSAAAMCYTSGTTGHPKGVVYSHRSSYLHSMGVCLGNAFGLSERDRVLPVVPMFHANAWGLAYAGLLSGADLIMPDRDLQPGRWSGSSSDEHVHRGRRRCRRSGTGCSTRAVDGRRPVLAAPGRRGGSAVPHALMEAFEKELGVRHPAGLGHDRDIAAGQRGAPARRREPGRGLVTTGTRQGRLFCTVEGRLVGDGGALLPSDGKAVGEVEVRGPWVTGSYYKDDDPAKFHDGWLRTGDVGTIDERGFIRLTDRAKDVIKSGGEWISSMELENALMAHPDVAEAAVIGVPDEKWGERPLAAVVLRPGAEVTAEKLRAFLTEQVPRWQLPERWCFVAEVPKTSVGKFSKRQMREAYLRGDYEIIEVR